MEWAVQKKHVKAIRDIFNEDAAMAAFMRYTLGGSVNSILHALTNEEMAALEAVGSGEDELEQWYEEAIDNGEIEGYDWDEQLVEASRLLGYNVKAIQARDYLKAAGLTVEDVFEGIDKDDAWGKHLLEIWNAY